MRVAARVLVLSTLVGVLGAADAKAPDLANAPTALTNVASPHDVPLARTSHDGDRALLAPRSTSTAVTPLESDHDFWLFSGVVVGLIAFQLRRKHRLLRPQSWQPRPDL